MMAAVMMGAVGIGCGGVEPEPPRASAPSATAKYLEAADDFEDNDHNQCGVRRCIDIERDKNITHVFLDFGNCPVKDFRVTVRTESRGVEDVTDRLKSVGGPCQELNADYRFELPGPDKMVRVCVQFKDYITKVRVGVKAADECTYESRTIDGNACRKCQQHQ
ncbi:hypothetical protein ATI61_105254 [Archangium gephyra]|uniref:Uncharacterized protein n=1 Tax=Archangium gephyra TaxID=48 RepID=A0AAC8QG58_9BACT|nr:hypothetical protein [Archangium gephyra]AKJ06774.1 Hypothetical protein AA314_08400 [Archangium gephyra]REG31927.1 hypothetical protein ATI61_105254 [Archangium gephyra]